MALTYEMGILEGRREVVEWIEENTFPDPRIGVEEKLMNIKISPTYWQEQLKEWGIDKPQSEDEMFAKGI